jgi:hypothetical protein
MPWSGSSGKYCNTCMLSLVECTALKLKKKISNNQAHHVSYSIIASNAKVDEGFIITACHAVLITASVTAQSIMLLIF